MRLVTDGTPATTRVLSGLEVWSSLKLMRKLGSKTPDGLTLTLPAEPVMPPGLDEPPPPPPAEPRMLPPTAPANTPLGMVVASTPRGEDPEQGSQRA